MAEPARMPAAVFGLLLVLSVGCAPPLPRGLEEEVGRTPRGAVTVVFFTDFQCPYCRRTHAALAPLLDAPARRGRVRVVHLHVPLRSHPNARDAARAAVCAERLGSASMSREIVHGLFTSPDLDVSTLEALAVGSGLDALAYRMCLSDASTERRIARDRALFIEAEGDGVPLIYVGRERLEGAPGVEELARALDLALGLR